MSSFPRSVKNLSFSKTDDCAMFTKHLVSTAELSGVVKEQKRKPLEREVDKDLTPAGKRCVVIFFIQYTRCIKKSEGSKSSTHYLSDTNRFDVSSKGPSSGISPSGIRTFGRNVESVCIA